jgi:hypothetical protein
MAMVMGRAERATLAMRDEQAPEQAAARCSEWTTSESPDPSRGDARFALAEQASDQAGLAQLVLVRGGSSPRHAPGCGYGHAELPLVQDVATRQSSRAARHGVAVVAFVAGLVAGRRRGGSRPR